MTDIKVCTDNPPSSNDIVVCTDKTPVDIIVCNDDGRTEQECTGVTDLSLTGTETPSVSSGYSGSGGRPPYEYSISCGSINSSGVITDLTSCCGTGSVTVTDNCGDTAHIDVRFPTGQWVFSSQEDYPAFNDGSAASTITTYTGGLWIRDIHNMPTCKEVNQTVSEALYNCSSCASLGKDCDSYDPVHELYYCCINSTRTVGYEAYPGANSTGTETCPGGGGAYDPCGGVPVYSASEVKVRAFQILTYTWEC